MDYSKIIARHSSSDESRFHDFDQGAFSASCSIDRELWNVNAFQTHLRPIFGNFAAFEKGPFPPTPLKFIRP